MALTLILAGLIGLITVTENQRLVASAAVQLLPTDQAVSININQNDTQWELQKQQGLWRLIRPIDADVNQDRITPLLSLLTLPDSTPYPVAEIDLDELGLTTPRATVQINNLTFVFGGPGPADQQRYLLYDNQVYLTRDILLPLIAGGVDSLVTTASE